MFNLAIDKLRGCDVVAVRVEDVAASGYGTGWQQMKSPGAFDLLQLAGAAIDLPHRRADPDLRTCLPLRRPAGNKPKGLPPIEKPNTAGHFFDSIDPEPTFPLARTAVHALID
jgi:hypothetical protein